MSEEQFALILEGINAQIAEIKDDFKPVWPAIDAIKDHTHQIELKVENRITTGEAQLKGLMDVKAESRISTNEEKLKNIKWVLGFVVVLIFSVTARLVF